MVKGTDEQLYEKYVADVLHRHEVASGYLNERKRYWQDKPLAEIKAAIKELMAKEYSYREFKEANQTNKFELLEKNAAAMIVMQHFSGRPEVETVRQAFIEDEKKIKDLPEEQRRKSLNIIEQRMLIKLGELSQLFEKEIKEKNLVNKFYLNKLVQLEENSFTRELINAELGGKSVDGKRDKGNCTKGITVSLLKLQKEDGVPLFSDNTDVENIIHPVEFTEQLPDYVKRAESGLLQDITGIKKGDIIFITRENGVCGHAMMCYDFNEHNEPLLLGFSPTEKGTNAYRCKSGKPRRGIVVDVKSFIRDKCMEGEKKYMQQPSTKRM